MTTCVALIAGGTRCQRPAIGIDYAKGEPVCLEHLTEALDRLEDGDCPACPPAGAPRHSELIADAQLQESSG